MLHFSLMSIDVCHEQAWEWFAALTIRHYLAKEFTLRQLKELLNEDWMDKNVYYE